MNRFRRGIGLALAVLLLVALEPRPAASRDAAPAAPVSTAVQGQGFWTALACAGCVAGAIGHATGGVGAILVAAAAEGSTLVVAACVGACIDAFK